MHKQTTTILKYSFSLSFCLAACFCGAQQTNTVSIQPSLDIRVACPPVPVRIEGKSTLVYELLLTNFYNAPLVISSITIGDAKDSSRIQTFGEDAVAVRLYKPGQKSGDARSPSLAPGTIGVFYIEAVAENVQPKASLYHTVIFRRAERDTEPSSVVTGAVVNVAGDSPVALGAPLAGGPWVAIHLPAWERGHRRVVYTVDGKARIPGRFAIDFIRLDENGMFAAGDEDKIKNWYGYGVAVLAVADGVVTSTRDDFQESPTVSGHPVHSSARATGNYIAMKISSGQFVFYEHLKPGSIRVNVGQKVKKGDVIASLGFTGQTTGPHLHFHVADADSPLGAEGLPFVFENFTILGFYPDFSTFGKTRWQSSNDAMIRLERPAPNSVIRFR